MLPAGRSAGAARTAGLESRRWPGVVLYLCVCAACYMELSSFVNVRSPIRHLSFASATHLSAAELNMCHGPAGAAAGARGAHLSLVNCTR